MEIVGTSDFQPDADLPIPGFPGGVPNPEESLPPSMQRSVEEEKFELDEFDKARLESQRKPIIPEREQLAGNEVTYKIVAVALTLISFFTLKVIDTLRIGLNNPYDKIFFIRL